MIWYWGFMHSISHGPLSHWIHWCRDPYGQVQLNAGPYATSSPPRDYLLPTPGQGNPTLSHYWEMAIKLVTRLLTKRGPDRSGSCLILIPTFCQRHPLLNQSIFATMWNFFWERQQATNTSAPRYRVPNPATMCKHLFPMGL